MELKQIADSSEESRIQERLKGSPLSQDVVGNLCVFKCDICAQEFKSSHTLGKHIFRNASHGSKRASLATSCGKIIIAHQCLICSSLIVCDRSYLTSHMQKQHKKSLKSYCSDFRVDLRSVKCKASAKWNQLVSLSETTDDINDSCEFECSKCSIRFPSWERMRMHIQESCRASNVTVLQYLKKCVLFLCKLCQSKILCDRRFIKDHLRRNHKMSEGKYAKNFLVAFSQRKVCKDYIKNSEENLTKNSIPSENQTPKMSYQQILQNCKKSQDIIGSLCVFSCNMCPKKFRCASGLTRHVKDNHEIVRSVDRNLVQFAEIIAHSCILCSTLILCDTERLIQHVSRKHNLSLKEYADLTGCTIKEYKGFYKNIMDASMTSKKVTNHCEFKCVACNIMYASWNSIKSHTKRKHKHQKLRYPDCITKRAYYNCKICSCAVLHDRHWISKHLYNKHRMTILEYETKLKDANVENCRRGKQQPEDPKTKKHPQRNKQEASTLFGGKKTYKVEQSSGRSGNMAHPKVKDCRVVLYDILASSDSEESDMG
jgi:hypothetical protein